MREGAATPGDEPPELKKMSKSLGNVLDPFEIIEEFGTDALRFYCMRDVTFGQDGEVSTARFAVLYESELANDLGNLASRTIAMVHRYRDGVVPDADLDPALSAEIDAAKTEVCALLDRADLTGALDAIWLRVRRLNRYVEERTPWVLAKDPERAGELDSVLASLVESLRVRRGAAAPLDPGERRTSCWRRSTRPQLELDGAQRPGRPARRDLQARPAVSQARVARGRPGDRQPHPSARLQARRRRPRRGGGGGGREADADRRHERRDLPRGAARPPSASRRSSLRSAATPTRRPASTTPTSPS